MTKPFIDPKSGTWLQRWRRKRVRWHRRQGHCVEELQDLIGLPITCCWDCAMSWSPVWGTGDTIISYHPREGQSVADET
jgi:hypothetical protein